MKKLYLLLFLTPLFSACKKEDNTPSWLNIDSFELTTNEFTEGVNSTNISDVWVYMDNEALGVFSLPARIPVLAEGEHNFTFYAGIKVNGISATRTRYPFYNRVDVTLNLIKGEDIYYTPSTTYKSNVQFEFIEDFENVGVDIDKDLTSDTDIVVITSSQYPEIVKYGNNCGAIYLNETDSLYKGATNTDLILPGGEDVFVEIDFMNTNSMVFGLIAENSGGTFEQTPYVQLNPQDPSEMVWKKIYIDLQENVSFEINATSFEFYLISILDANNVEGVVYLDNIKVLRYQ